MKIFLACAFLFLLQKNNAKPNMRKNNTNNKKIHLKNIDNYNYMDKLSQYDEHIQQFIVNIGSFMYDKSKDFFEQELTEKNALEKWNLDYNLDKINNEKRRLEERVREKEKENYQLKENVFQMKEEEREKFENSILWYKQQLEENQKITFFKEKNYEQEISSRLSRETEQLNKRIQELTKKNKWYHDLYESNEKGTNYEEELYPKLLDYNDKFLNSIWQITHIGQVMGEKSDFHFKNKVNDQVILIDTKNNLPTNPIANTDNFVRDVKDKKTNAIGGIMLANGKICNKKQFEINMDNGKYLVFVSNFDRNNVPYVFSLLDEIIELSFLKQSRGDKDKLKELLIENYKREIQQLDGLEKNKKTILKNIDELIQDYQNFFKEDISMEIKKNEISNSSVRIREKTSKKIEDFDELEKDRKVVGQRSKYFLQYDENNEKKIQYFKNNYARGQKVKSLQKKTNNEENIIIIDDTA